MTRTRTAGPVTEIAAIEGGALPSRIELMPTGRVGFGDSRTPVTLSDPAAVIARSLAAAPGGVLPIDFDHGADRDGGSTRAAGWITGLTVEGDRILADVDWTPEGAAALQSRSYRFISPVYLADKATRRVMQILRAGLTNTPALPQLKALAAIDHDIEEEGRMDPHLNEIAAALGLGEDATPEAVVAAVTATVAETAAAKTAARPDPAQWAPRTALDALTREVAALRAERAAETAGRAVAAARAAGKLAPALEDWATEYAAADPEGFAAWVEAAPAIAAPGSVMPKAPGRARDGLDATEKQVCALMGVDPQKFLATRQAGEETRA